MRHYNNNMGKSHCEEGFARRGNPEKKIKKKWLITGLLRLKPRNDGFPCYLSYDFTKL